MKIQCPCGAKHHLEVTPEMAGQPVKFVCSQCGLDSSDTITQLVRSQFAQPDPAPAPVPATAPATPRPVRVAVPAAPVAAPTSSQAEICSRHAGQECVAKCYLCQKPICPVCMETFGYLCSALCKAKAESHGISVPLFEGQRSVRAARKSRILARGAAIAGTLLALLLAFWIWYSWFGSEPKPVFSVRFEEPRLSGASWRGGEKNNDLVFLHGATLARYDLASEKKLWSTAILDPKSIEQMVSAEMAEMSAWIARARDRGSEYIPRMPDPEKLRRRYERRLMESLDLRVHGRNIWVLSPGKATLHDWQSGAAAKEIVIPEDAGTPVLQSGTLMFPVRTEEGRRLARLDLASGNYREEPLPAVSGSASPRQMASGPSMPSNQLDPGKIAERARSLPLSGKIALPAILAGALRQQQLEAAMADADSNPATPGQPGAPPAGSSDSLVIPTQNGFVTFSTRLLEFRAVERAAMKDPPKESALERAPSVANSMEMANEVLNEMRRNLGQDKVRENVSRYQVTVRDSRKPEGWTGEVIGPPAFYPLTTVDVIASHRTITVLSKDQKKLFDAPLSHQIVAEVASAEPENPHYGQGPCVERDGRLYVFDAGMLTAFDLAKRSAVWRLPSVGISAMFFDGEGNIYLNTTSAGAEDLKFSKQIDITRNETLLVVKVDASNGSVLWRAESRGEVHYVADKFIYTLESYMPDDTTDDMDGLPYVETGFERPPYLRLKRLNPGTGRVLWEHFQQRAPLDARFDENSIRLVFKKEVVVLRFLSWF